MSEARQAAEARLRELAGYERGWLWGDGEPIHPMALDRAQEVVGAAFDLGLTPHIYPHVEGMVCIEIDRRHRGLCIDCTGVGFEALAADGEEDREFGADWRAALAWLAEER